MTSLSEIPAQSLLDSISTAVLLLSADAGKPLYTNPAFQALSGSEGTMAQNIQTLFRLDDNVDCTVCKGHPAGEPPVHGAFLQAQAGEEEVRVKVKHTRLSDGSWLLLIDPFSEDAALTQAHSDFVSTVSHEFRTPLTSIKGFADTLIKYGAQLPDEEKRRFVSIIKEQAERLIRMVENLLTVSKLGAHRMQMSYRPIPLGKMLDRVIENIQAKYPTQRKFEVTIAPSVTEVWADADRFEQILINLIDNAFKYSKPETKVTITADIPPEDESLIRITVKDQGVGIPKDKLPQLFTKFYRIETPLTQDVEGTGLGLYIVKSLVNAMDGKIDVDSEPGEGTTVTLVFPAATPERQAAHRRRLTAEEEG